MGWRRWFWRCWSLLLVCHLCEHVAFGKVYDYFVDVKYLDILFACMLLLYEMLHMVLGDLKLSFVYANIMMCL